MGQTAETTWVHLNKNCQGVVTCVYCSIKHTIHISNYTEHHLGKKSLKVKCGACNKTSRIKFDLRRHHRINTNIPGRIVHTHTAEETKDIIILSLSVGGVGFTIHKDLDVKTGDMYTIQFQLDDKYSSVICEAITIKHVDGRFVSAEFSQSDRYNHELDFYIVGIL